jgi:hypothetical protein
MQVIGIDGFAAVALKEVGEDKVEVLFVWRGDRSCLSRVGPSGAGFRKNIGQINNTSIRYFTSFLCTESGWSVRLLIPVSSVNVPNGRYSQCN